MKLQLIRTYFGNSFTLGSIYIDTKWVCYTLEDKVREEVGKPVEEWKIFGCTAIPKGTYEVEITFSNHFQKELPELMNVPGFVGVRIHTGNDSQDTEGCILVGSYWDEKNDWIGGSAMAFAKLSALLIEPIEIEIS